MSVEYTSYSKRVHANSCPVAPPIRFPQGISFNIRGGKIFVIEVLIFVIFIRF